MEDEALQEDGDKPRAPVVAFGVEVPPFVSTGSRHLMPRVGVPGLRQHRQRLGQGVRPRVVYNSIHAAV